MTMDSALPLRIRPATPDDLDVIEALEKRIFTTPWSREALRPELEARPDRMGLLAVVDDRPIGYALVWVVADELHLVTLGVERAYRRRGVARALLRALTMAQRAQRARLLTLEVRASNRAALAFYRSEGFREVALRLRYYPDNKEDAVVMLKELPGDPNDAAPF
jgi:ribosomal-protein-alanine N-acetyltransferase